MSGREIVHRLTFDGKEIVLVGAAHISKESAQLAEQIIIEERPETVCLELCQSRFRALTENKKYQIPGFHDAKRILAEESVPVLLNLIFSYFQERIGQRLGIKPGEEILRAAESARRVGACIHLVDRDARITFLRIWRLMPVRTKLKLFGQLIASLSEAESISREDIENLKEQDALEKLMDELGELLPELREIIIDERDQFLAHMIRTAPGGKIVALVGAGHVAGIKRYWTENVDMAALNQIPPRRRVPSFFKWGIPAFVVVLIILRYFSDGDI